jgi:hypothetical protein
MSGPVPSVVFCTAHPARGLREAIERIDDPRIGLHVGAPSDLSTPDAVYVSAMSGLDHGVELSYTRATVVRISDRESRSPRVVVVGLAAPIEEEINVREETTRQVHAVLRAVREYNAAAEYPVKQLAIDLDWLVGTGDAVADLVIDAVSTVREFLETS